MSQNLQLSKGASQRFMWHVHYFRALAIFCIVMVHSWIVPPPHRSTGYAQVIDVCREVLFHSSSIFFIFISGYLFHHLSGRFNLRSYARSKWSFVICPYLVITTGLFLWRKWMGDASFDGSLWGYGRAVLWGTMQVQMWYIPFIVMVYVVSPLLLKVNDQGLRWLLWVCLALPLLGTREGVSPYGGSIFYFAPIFVVGFAVAKKADILALMTRRFQYPLVFVVLVSSVVLFYGEWRHENASAMDMRWRESLFYVQKLPLCLLILEWAKRLPEGKLWLGDQLAKASFGVYFVHPFLQVDPIRFRMFDFLAERSPALLVVVSMAYSCGVVLLSLAVVRVICRLLGKKSRFLIGC